MIEKLLQDLQADEGWRDHAYDDATGRPIEKGKAPSGYVTIGYGFCIDHNKGAPLPKPVGLYWLEYAVEMRWNELVDRLPWIVDQPEDVQRALGNMAYQLGIYGLLRFALMLEALKVGDRVKAAEEALDSTWARQTPKRAKRVAALIRGAA